MLPTRVDPTYTAYSVTPTLSVAAGHATVIAVGVLDEAVSVAGLDEAGLLESLRFMFAANLVTGTALADQSANR